MVGPIGRLPVLLLQFLLLNIDPLVVEAVSVLIVVPGVSRLLLNSEPIALPSSPATSLCLVSPLSPPLAVPGPTAGPLAPLPVPTAAPPPPVPGPGPVSPPPLSAPAPLPPVLGAAAISPPVAVSVSLSAPVTTSVVTAGVTDVHIGPALPCAAQPSSCK